ncbi:MAG: YHYH protein [Chloroflexota bacterium]
MENGEPVQTTVTIPIIPVVAENPSYANINRGITLNGVIIANSAPVDAILGAYTIAVFDDCGGHINPFDGYHLHGAVGCSEVGEAIDGETPIFAYALDGYPIHSPLEEEYVETIELDECGGHYTEDYGYHYHANPAEENAVLMCFTGLTVQDSGEDDHNDDVSPDGEGGRPPQGGNGEGRPGGQGQLDFEIAAETLEITVEELMDALGGPPPDFEAAAETLGITVEELMNAFDTP